MSREIIGNKESIIMSPVNKEEKTETRKSWGLLLNGSSDGIMVYELPGM